MTVRSPLRSRFLIGVSAGALILAGSPADAGSGASNPFARTVDPAAAAAASAAAKAAQSNTAIQASQRALAAFAQAAALRQKMDSTQTAARAAQAAAAAAAHVINGLGGNGLVVDPDVAGDPSLWVGASAPTQSTGSDGRTKVDIDQTQKQAILNWQTFNVGQNTDVNFNQGGSNWAVLNRVNDPSANPTQILGTIHAPGTVLIMNRNGVIFGGASQVNVGNLVAAAGAMTDSQFLNNGIYSALNGNSYTPVVTDALGKVQVDAGAQITTNDPATVLSGGGYVMLLGGSVENDGSITTPDGQALLAAGDSFAIRQGLGTTANQYSTTRGNEIAPTIATDSTNGTVVNAGEITADEGDITLAGRTLLQNGILLSTSSVTQRGTIHLLNSSKDAEGSITFTGDSYTAVLPEFDSTTTALDSQRDQLIADSATQNTARTVNANGQFDDLSILADREDQSRIEINTGGNVEFQNGSLAQAQGGQIATSAGNRIQVDSGATLDVSGVQNVALDVATNDILINVQGNELRDSPVNRDNPDKTLYSGADDGVWVDARDLIYVPAGTGGDTSDRYYTAGGLLEVSGYVADTGHTIGEWDSVGGTITLSAKEVVAQTNSLFDVAGGSLAYQGGDVTDTLLQGADGNMYTANDAPANVQIVSIGKSFSVLHPRWGAQYTETYQNPFAQTTVTHHEDGYVVGKDGGQLILSTPTAIFDGTIEAETIQGTVQTNAHPAGVTDGYKVGQTQAALNGGLFIGQYNSNGLVGGYDTDVQFGDGSLGNDAASQVDVGTSIDPSRTGTAWFDASQLSNFGLGSISIATSGDIAVNSSLTLADGGNLSLTGAAVGINANVTARSGSITATNIFKASAANGSSNTVFSDPDDSSHVTVADNVTLDLRGIWTNELTDPDTVSNLAYANGGNVTLDSSQNVTVGKGAVIDVSSGGGVLLTGKTEGGRGGNVSLVAGDITGSGINNPAAVLTLDGTIHAEGVLGGGTLTISAPGSVAIGDDATLSGGQLTLAPGTPAHVNLTLAAPVTIPPGDPLPLPFSQTSTKPPLDTPLPVPVVGAQQGSPGTPTDAAWTVPFGPGGAINTVFTTNGLYLSGSVVPAHSTITVISGTLAAGYVIPSSVFPDGLTTQPFTLVFPAGAPASTPVTYAAGTVIPAGTVFDQVVSILPVTTFDPKLFQSGFSNYVVNAGAGLLLASGTNLDVTMPVLQITGDSMSARSGTDPKAAMSSWLPPLFLENPQTATLTQRGGASITLQSVAYNGGTTLGGAISVPDGGSITVDPGQSIKLDAFGQITVDGDLTAHGGSISLINESTGDTDPSRNFDPSGNNRALSIWVGDNATIDVSGEAYTATDIDGRTYGTVTKGGSIEIGGTQAVSPISFDPASTQAYIIIRPGAELDADGASIAVDPTAGTTAQSAGEMLNIATDGGSISLDSYSGFYLDGAFHARAGGAGALGGSFAINLDVPIYGSFNGAVQANDLPIETLTVVQHQGDSLLPADMAAGTDPNALTLGQGTISADQITSGGFANLSLNSRDFLTFQGDVTLDAAQSVTLTAGAISSTHFLLAPPAADSDPVTGHVTINSAYVLFSGATVLRTDNSFNAVIGAPGLLASPTDATFTVNADEIDIQGSVGFSASAFFNNGIGYSTAYAPGFADVSLNSRGDIRFLAPAAHQQSYSGFFSPSDIDLTAAQIYPTTGTLAIIAAANGLNNTPSTLTISRSSDVDPGLPLSVFGQITLNAGIIDDGGIVRAPLGAITIGGEGGIYGSPGTQSQEVNLLPGSITSVSGAGLVIPYGGTPDGVNYNYNGAAVNPAIQTTGLTLDSVVVNVDKGALIDTSGGATVAGAAFIPGRGGSVDVLGTALASANPTTPLSSGSDKVYAIVPGYAADYAPDNSEKGAGDPVIGQQITIPAGVPGLPAGTYTLLPSNYALLPGAYRVEIGKTTSPLAGGVNAIGNGTYAAVGYTSIANTGEKSALPSTLLITSGTDVRSLSQYDEETYSDFLAANAGTIANAYTGNPIQSPADAEAFTVRFEQNNSGTPLDGPVFSFAGTLVQKGGAGGSDGATNVTGGFNDIEIYADAPTDGFAGVSLSEASLALLQPVSLDISGQDVFIRPNVTIEAAQIVLNSTSFGGGNIDVGEGATLSTIGMGDAPVNGTGNRTTQYTTLALSNGEIDYTSATGTGAITIENGASLFAGGTLAFATNGPSSIDSGAHFGAKNINLAVSTVNIGDADDIAAAGNPTGLQFDQALFDFLINGDPTHGAPALESLTLSASSAINVFGDASLDASGSGVDLVLTTPAIYGYGAAGDTATIAADKITWNGIANGKPPAILDGGPGTGAGTIDIKASEIDLGTFKSGDSANYVRSMYGFGTVNLDATDRIVSAGKGMLAVYQAPSNATDAVFGQSGTGGNLNISTPVLTGAQKSDFTYAAGDTIDVSSPVGTVSTATSTLGGGEIDLDADNVAVNSTILLPSGQFVINATHDIDLGANSRIDLSGQTTEIIDATVYGFGGNAILASSAGNVTQEAGSVIDVSATHNDAGTVKFEADNGTIAVGGTLNGTADDGFTSGDFVAIGNTLGDFAALNGTLNTGGFFDARSFDLKTGNLVIGDGVKAHDVEVSVDGGSLTVDGTIDASGAAPGTIRLAGKDGLTIASTGVLDAHGNTLQVDSYGQPIDAKNRGEVELAAAGGTLTLASGATIDVSAPDGVARGDIELDAQRTSETGGDLAIDASGPLTIKGAQTIAVNGFWTYSPTDPYGTIVQDNGEGANGAVVNGDGWLGMNQIDSRSQAFITAALGNQNLLGRLQGLSAYSDAFHLRPGVEIDSATPDGTLTIAGDIDLSGFRYASLNPNSQKTGIYGSGEPGALVIRAGGNLDIVGSISDGFAPAPATPDDSGWLLQSTPQYSSLPGAIEVLLPVTLNPGTTFPSTGGKLRYAIPINAASIAANAVVPAQVTLSSDLSVPAGTKLTAPVYAADGTTVLYPAGTVFASATTLPAGSQLGAGSRMPTNYTITAMTWPAGADLDAFSGSVTLSGSTVVPFEGIIPAGSAVQVTDTVPTRPAGSSGAQGTLDAVAAMLPQGELSWSIRLVSGADLGAADTRLVKPASLLKKLGVSGNLTLSDQHVNYTPGALKEYFYYYYPDGRKLPTKYQGDPATNPYCTNGVGTCVPVMAYGASSINGPDTSVVRTGTGNLDLIAGGSFDEATLYGVYTAGTQSAPILAADGSNPYNQPLGAEGGQITPVPSRNDVDNATYQAWYPEHGGDVFVSAQGNLTQAVSYRNNTTTFTDTDSVANWLWHQGGGGIATQPTAWWVNFGTYANTYQYADDATLIGFEGIGTLGGGNLTVTVGGDAGNTKAAQSPLDLAVASTGRVLPDGTIVETGGGDLTLKVGGTINNIPASNSGLGADSYGVITDLRGDIAISAGSYGTMAPTVGNDLDPRAPEVGVSKFVYYTFGPQIIPGDGTVQIDTRGDLSFGGAGDATMLLPLAVAGNPFTQINADGSTTFNSSDSTTLFTLWRPATGISLFSSGGDVGATAGSGGSGDTNNPLGFYPGTLIMAAQSGDIRFSGGGTQFGGGEAIELMPSPIGQLELLAYGSIYGQNQVVAMSGASMDSLATPQHPAFYGPNIPGTLFTLTNVNIGSPAIGGASYKGGEGDPIAFGPDTPTDNLHAGDGQPALVYAGTDIDDLEIGQVQQQTASFQGTFIPSPTTWYIAAKPFDVIAGRDIVGMGTVQNAGGFQTLGSTLGAFYNPDASDITEIHAGRDIYFEAADIAGSGLLDVQAGRNIMQGYRGAFESVGPQVNVDPTDPSTGASISIVAGAGPDGPDYADFANLYLNPANAADPTHPLAGQSGKALQTPNSVTALSDLAGWLKTQFGYSGDSDGALAYFNALPATQRARYPSDPTLFAWLKETQGYTGDQGDALAAFLGLSAAKQGQFTYNAMLTIWLQQRFGYTGDQAGAYAYFTALPSAQQGVFVRQVYYDELTEGGREFNDPTSERSQSYLRGEDAIAALFPTKDAQGNRITYTGDLTMYSGFNGVDGSGKPLLADSGIRTDFGGDIQILNPGGQTLLGVEGIAPGPDAGLLTQGVGDIEIYSEGSILLGESRILTTFGGDILAWSSDGDINSGRGAKTTVIFTPPRRIYDEYGDVTLSPSVPSSGAGIGTLAPIADVPPGDVDLIAPLGTVDAGEAGIRVSGNVNIAALHIINAANIEVKGNATGIPTVVAVNTGALTSASSTAAAVAAVADQLAERARPQIVPQPVPYIITGSFLGFGD